MELPEFKYWYQLTGASAAGGFLFGSLVGARLSGLRYTAENSHKKPNSKSGWFLYHRHKKYAMILGGVKRGLYDAGRIGILLGGFLGTDVLLDYAYHDSQWWHGPVSGLLTGCIFSVINEFPKRLTLKAVGLSTLMGICYTASIHAGLGYEGKEYSYENKYSITTM